MISVVILALLICLVALVLVPRGGLVESLRSGLVGRGAGLGVVAVATLLLAGAGYRQLFYMTPEHNALITRGATPADTVSPGINTKTRFRSLVQPLGRITDRNGELLATYAVRDGHLRRTYPAGNVTSHIVGYWAGLLRDGMGLEKTLTLLNDSLKDDLPHDLKITLDLRLQRQALRALDGRTGAVVVINASTGELLAAANEPTFDPDAVWDEKAWKKYSADKFGKPLISRAIKDNFSPGSSIKPFVAAAAHMHNTPLPESRNFACTGTYTPAAGITPISDHAGGHGRVDIHQAMRYSCNCYFSYLAYQLVGFNTFQAYLDSLGFNSRLRWNSALKLNNFATLLPAQSWIKARHGDQTAMSRAGIGQASVKTNPLHLAVLMAGIANYGLFLRPCLEPGRRPDTLRYRGMDSASTLWLRGLLRQPLLPGGTAAGVFSGLEAQGITIYGKTGTADPEPDGREPSWFISFGEKNNHRFAVVVAIQNRKGQLAGSLNAPIAREVYQSLNALGYFQSVQVITHPADNPTDTAAGAGAVHNRRRRR